MTTDNILSMKLEKSKADQTITVSYFIPEKNRNCTEEIKEQPHIDFINALHELSPFLAKVFYVNAKKEDLYSATGFKFNAHAKVIITGKVATESGSIVGIATPAIDLDEETYGFEKDLKEVMDILVGETEQLLTGKKVGVKQLTIDDSIKTNELLNEEDND